MSNILYNKSSEWINKETGEVIKANELVKKVGRKDFMITYLSTIIHLLDIVGNKKLQVIKYILENMEMSTNTLIITTSELSKKANVSRQIVSDTLKILEKGNIISRRTGAIMINPELVHRGNELKEKILMTRFIEFEN